MEMKKILILALLLISILSFAACGNKPTQNLGYSKTDEGYDLKNIGDAATLFGGDVKNLVIPDMMER